MLYDTMLTSVSVGVQALTDGTETGDAVDRAVNGGMQDGVLIVVAGTVTDGDHAVALEESDDGSTEWTAVPDTQLEGELPTLASTESGSVVEVGFRSTKRYVRAAVTTSESETGGVVGALIALNSPRFSPVARG